MHTYLRRKRKLKIDNLLQYTRFYCWKCYNPSPVLINAICVINSLNKHFARDCFLMLKRVIYINKYLFKFNYYSRRDQVHLVIAKLSSLAESSQPQILSTIQPCDIMCVIHRNTRALKAPLWRSRKLTCKNFIIWTSGNWRM